MTVLTINPVAPHDLELSMRVMSSFAPDEVKDPSVLRVAVRIHGEPTVLEFRQRHRAPPVIEVHTDCNKGVTEVRRIAKWLICADLDLQPFYRVALSHPVLALIVEELHGLKPMRPASLFEMLVIAVTEQQISMAAAYRIRHRIVESFGDEVDDLWAFPTYERLAETPISELIKCGLSQRKAEYVGRLAYRVSRGLLDLERLPTLSDEEVFNILFQERGIGPWSADYLLIRGLSRPDRVPVDDLGIRAIAGRYLGSGQRLTAQGVMRKLSSFKPYRGLAAFYLLAYARLSKNYPLTPL